MGKGSLGQFLIGTGEGLGLLLISQLGSYGALQILIFSSIYYILKEKAWEIPPNAFTSSSVNNI